MPDGLLIYKAVIVLLVLIYASYLLISKSKNKKKSIQLLKKNVSLLRQEKLITNSDLKLQKKRRRILKQLKNIDVINSPKWLKKSKKMGLTTGEMILAAKIKVNSK